ncbi:MAG: cupredoxin domain-containing protein [Candidatus Levyibacteriota bacterium]
MKALVIIIVLIILAGGGYYYYQSQHTVAAPAMQHTNTTTVHEGGSMKASPTTSASSNGAMMKEHSDNSVKQFTVEGKNFSMTPSKLSVNKGDKVEITYKNTDGTHDFVLDEFNARTKVLQGGEEATVSFTADKAGSFHYYCSVGNHRAMGMVGTLTVN